MYGISEDFLGRQNRLKHNFHIRKVLVLVFHRKLPCGKSNCFHSMAKTNKIKQTSLLIGTELYAS